MQIYFPNKWVKHLLRFGNPHTLIYILQLAKVVINRCNIIYWLIFHNMDLIYLSKLPHLKKYLTCNLIYWFPSLIPNLRLFSDIVKTKIIWNSWKFVPRRIAVFVIPKGNDADLRMPTKTHWYSPYLYKHNYLTYSMNSKLSCIEMWVELLKPI